MLVCSAEATVVWSIMAAHIDAQFSDSFVSLKSVTKGAVEAENFFSKTDSF